MAKERRIFGGRNNAAPSDEARNFSTPGFRGRGQATYEQTVAPPSSIPTPPNSRPPTFQPSYHNIYFTLHRLGALKFSCPCTSLPPD